MAHTETVKTVVARDISQVYLLGRIAQTYVGGRLEAKTAQSVRSTTMALPDFQPVTYRRRDAATLFAGLTHFISHGDPADYAVAAARVMRDEQMHPHAREINDIPSHAREMELSDSGAPSWTEELVVVQALKLGITFEELAGRTLARDRVSHGQDFPSAVMVFPPLSED